MDEKKIGVVLNYYAKISVAAIELSDETLSVGDTIHFLGHTTDFESRVHSMQMEHNTIQEAHKGDQVGIKVPERVREGDRVYKIDSE
jgi:putative protease